MHVIERQPRARERLLPGLPALSLSRYGLRCLDALDGRRETCLRRPENAAASIALVSPQALLQRLFRRTLQWWADCGADGVGIRGDRTHPGQRLGLARDVIDEVEGDITARPLERHHRRERRQ